MKLPAFQFYPGDWRKDPGVQSLDYEARGVWFEILCLMHESERRGILLLNGKAMTDEALARLLGLDIILLKQILTTLDNHGVTSRDEETGALMSRRMVRDEELRQTRSKSGKQGGNPVLLKQNPTTHLKQNPTPSSSASSSDNTTHTPREGEEPEPSDDTHPPGFEPPLKTWVAECARYLIPEWYAKARWETFSAKGWRSGHTPLRWRRLMPLVKRDFVNIGSPMTEQAAAPPTGPKKEKITKVSL